MIELRESNAVIQIQILYDDDSTHIFEYQTTQWILGICKHHLPCQCSLLTAVYYR